MTSRALASPSLATRHQGSFMFLAWTQTTAPTLCRPAVTSASRSLRALPPTPTHSAAARVFAVGRRDMDVAAKPDDIGETQLVEKGEKLGLAKAAIGQDRHRYAPGQHLGQPG